MVKNLKRKVIYQVHILQNIDIFPGNVNKYRIYYSNMMEYLKLRDISFWFRKVNKNFTHLYDWVIIKNH